MVQQGSQGSIDPRASWSGPEGIQRLQEAFIKSNQGVYEGITSLHHRYTTLDARRTKRRGGK